jgi:phosphatidylglycerophosphate synthase
MLRDQSRVAVPEATPARAFDGLIAMNEGGESIVGGLALLERAAFVLARAGARRLLCLGPRPSLPLRLPDLPVTWDGDPTLWIRDGAPIIVGMTATTVTNPDTVIALTVADASGSLVAPPPAVLWRIDRTCLTTMLRDRAAANAFAAPDDARPWVPPAAALLCNAHDARSRTAAERELYSRLGRNGDGWLTRVVDRRISGALTRLLLPTGVSPNQVTIASIGIGIASGWCFARGTPAAATVGALLFLLSTIVDGCDGEMARLTFRESPFGARLDILGDNLVHLFLFGGIALGLYRRSGDPLVAVLGPILLGGVLLAMGTVYACIIRRAPNPAQRGLFEAFASREFAYLLVILTLAGRLDWFLWLSATGTYAFAIGLWVLGRRATV